jgi:YgiT-type zinc finger domain-containing protein
MKCHYCKGLMKPGKVSYTINRAGYHLVIDNVPALVCQQCGEPYYDEKEVDMIQDMIKEIDTKSGELQQFVV